MKPYVVSLFPVTSSKYNCNLYALMSDGSIFIRSAAITEGEGQPPAPPPWKPIPGPLDGRGAKR